MKHLPALFLSLMMLVLSGCAAAPPETAQFFAMDTMMTVTAYGSGASEAVQAVQDEVNRLDSLWSTGKTDSEIARLNAAGGGQVGDETAALLARALEISAQTGGAFDCTIYPVEAAWGFYSGNYCVLSDDDLKALLPLVGSAQITLDQNKVMFARDGMAVDLGGIAKGAAAGNVTQLLKERGISSAIVSLGGNIRAVGTKPDGSDWAVGITDPDDPSSIFATLSVSDCAVVTSGDYQRCFEQDGVTYHHILDPATGRPADSGLRSVTIVSQDDTLADGLSTALFVMGLDKASQYWRSSADFEAVFVTKTGEIRVTQGLKDGFSCDRPWEVIAR